MRLLRRSLISSVALLSLATLLVTARPAAAQTSNEDEGIGVGVLGLLGFPSLRGTNLNTSLDAKSTYGVGLWVGGNKNGRVGFTGEFIYLVKKIELGEGEAKQKALQIPAVFHINVGSSSRNNIGGYGILGPVFTINMNDDLSGGLTGDNFAGADIGIIAGVGVEITRVGIEARGNWGLRNISDAGVTSDTKTFTFEILGKFRFN
jgi:hypothetical protein